MKTKKISESVKQAPTSMKTLFIVLIFVLGFILGLMALVIALSTSRQQVAVVTVPVTNSSTSTASDEQQPYNDDIFNPQFKAVPYSASTTLEVAWNKSTQLNEEQAEYFFRSINIKDPFTLSAVARALATSTQIWRVGSIVQKEGGDKQYGDIYLWRHYQPIEIGGDWVVYNYIIEKFEEGSSRLLLVPIDGPLLARIDSTNFIPAPDIKVVKRESGLKDILQLENGKNIVRSEKGFIGPWGPGETYQAEYMENGKVSLPILGKTSDARLVYASDGCLIVFGDDDKAYVYASLIDDVDKISWERVESTSTSSFVPYLQGGCGFHDCVDIILESEVGDVVKAGFTAQGEVLFIPKNPTRHEEFKKLYENAWFGDAKPSLEEYAKKYPNAFFFWKDAFGRWVRYVRSDLQPAVECGKPVIYLYPEKTTNVSVRLPSFINVTKSDPTYPSAGWKVIAHPNGALDYADGKTYGSLFWEGTGVGYEVPKEGFILKDGEVDARLTEILSKYGLNETESREFREFWIPEMTGAPYYRVSFLTSEWSKAAPLFVSPRPTTAIRIFMDWQKLNAPISLPEPTIVTPERNGFTLVEWGGLLH